MIPEQISLLKQKVYNLFRERIANLSGRNPEFITDRRRSDIYSEGEGRLFFHDTLHYLIYNIFGERYAPFTRKGEEAVGTMQAVLFRDVEVSQRVKHAPLQEDAPQHPSSLAAIYKITLPGIRKFLISTGVTYQKDGPMLTSEEITGFYNLARMFDPLFQQKYGVYYAQQTAEDLNTRNPDELLALMVRAKELTEKTNLPGSPFTGQYL